jgi:hypothetical protein
MLLAFFLGDRLGLDFLFPRWFLHGHALFGRSKSNFDSVF